MLVQGPLTMQQLIWPPSGQMIGRVPGALEGPEKEEGPAQARKTSWVEGHKMSGSYTGEKEEVLRGGKVCSLS